MAPTYFDPSVDLFGTYFYSVDVVTANGQSAVSSEFQVRVIDLTLGIPTAPTGLHTTATLPDTISLAWEPVAGALFYQLFRSTEEDGVFTQLQVAPTAAADDSDALRSFRSYYYRVRVVTPGGISRYSDTLAVDPRFIAGRHRPERPRNLQGAFASPFTVELSWDASDGALGY
jgi:hypothetical protein